MRADSEIAQQYVHARNLLTETPGTASDLAADQNTQPPISRIYELSGIINGSIASGGSPVLIMACTNGQSVEFTVPQAFLDSASDWLTNGSTVRVLVRSELSGSGASNNNVLDLVAAGPESEVSSLEKQLISFEQQLRLRVEARENSRLLRMETSRSAALESRSASFSGPVSGLSDRAAAIYPSYRSEVARLNPRLSDSDVETITKSILSYSDEYQIDPRLIIAMIVAESGFDPWSVSDTGAAGLGQLMPETAAELGVTNRFDPQQNIAAAVHLLSTHVQNYGGAAPCGVIPLNTLMLTMAAYNAGPGAVKKYGGIPPYRETRNYVRRVSQLYRELCGS